MQSNQQTKRYLSKSNCFQASQDVVTCHKPQLNIDITNGIDIYTYHYLKQQNKLKSFTTQAKPSTKKQVVGIASYIDELGLINMNARLYAPEVARFLSADSFIQGLIAEASGGSFQNGFAAGFSGHLAGGLSGSLIGKVGNNTDFVSVVSRTTIAATIGGLAAQATGGNFEDGAYQAAMVHLFNDETDWINTIGGRKLSDGPTNGNWGGKCWSGGQYSCNGKGMGNLPPVDSADVLYMKHDYCYAGGGGGCDTILINDLRGLGTKTKSWNIPPSTGTEKDTIRYMWGADKWFKYFQ